MWCDSTSTSDHYPIFPSLYITSKPPLSSTTFPYRRINSICLPAFISDLSNSQLITNPPTTLPKSLSSFYDTLRSLLDKHAPLITKNHFSPPLLTYFCSKPTVVNSNASTSSHTFSYISSNFDPQPINITNSSPPPNAPSTPTSYLNLPPTLAYSGKQILSYTVPSHLLSLQLHPEPLSHSVLLHSSLKRFLNFISNFYLLPLPCPSLPIDYNFS